MTKRKGGTPPSEHRFKPGQSGNPGGRPKGRRNARTVAIELLERTIATQLNGKRITVTTLEALLQAYIAYLSKNPKDSIRFFEWLDGRQGLSDVDVNPALTDDDREVLDDLYRRQREAEVDDD